MFIQRTELLTAARNVYFCFARNLLIILSFIFVSLGLGMLGYHHLGQMSWVDAFLNASMILSGMGPVATLTTPEAKLFAGCYALFSGLAFLGIFVMMISPFIHHFFREIHLENTKDNE